jgi:hypothetical protein
MLTGVLLALSCAAPAEAKKDAPPPKVELFARERWYRDQKGAEQVFVGLLRYHPRPKGVAAIGRHNDFSLLMKGKDGAREVYSGGKPELLRPYAGKQVKITGKPVELEVVGQVHREIWPARLEVVPAAAKAAAEEENCCEEPAPAKKLRIEASCYWGSKAEHWPLQKVVRSDAELLKLVGMPVGKEKEARAYIEERLKTKGIDWNKQMLIFIIGNPRPAAGYRVVVKELVLTETGKGRKLTVRWEEPRKGWVAMPLRRHGLVVLTERFDGPVQFVPGLPKAKPAPK